MKRAVVFGATGFVGAHLVEALSRHGVEVYALYRAGSVRLSRICGLPGVQPVCFDPQNDAFADRTIFPQKADVFYHVAWENASGARRRAFLPQVKNVALLNAAVRLARQAGCEKIVAAGTVSERLCERIDGMERFAGAAYYLYAKRFAHSMLQQLAAENGLELVWCTFCHPLGRYNKRDQILADTICSLTKGAPLRFGSGQNLFDVIAAEDLAEAFYLAGKTRLSERTYYIGSGCPRKLRDYLETAAELVNPARKCELTFDEARDDGLGLLKEWLDPSEFCRETGFVPRVSFSDAVLRTAAWLSGSQQIETEMPPPG